MIRTVLRMSHIFFGSVTLVAAIAAISMVKGSVGHRTAGRVFVWAGRAVLGTAFISTIWALLHPSSFVGGMTASERAEMVTPLRIFFGVLGVLLLLVAADLETGLAGIRKSHKPRFMALGTASMIAGAALLVGGMYGLASGYGGVTWFALILGVIGLGDGHKVRNRVVSSEPLVSHLNGMIGAAGGFLAAFLVFGAGRILPFSFVEGDLLAAAPILLAMVIGHLLTTYWTAKVQPSSVNSWPNRQSL